MKTDDIIIHKTLNPREYLAKIDMDEADADFSGAVSENDEDIYSIIYQGSTVGLALLESDCNAFLYVYIFPEFRGRGFGKTAVLLLEQKLRESELVDISTCYRSEDPIACAFAESCGYKKEFSSEYMVYSGPLFENVIAPIRQYQDEDYLEAHSLSSEAFHLMRLSTGCFPNSVPDPPSEETRKYWAETMNERLVYMLENEIVGYAHTQGNEISDVSVKPSCQGKGIGKRFLKYIINMLINNGHTRIFLYCVVGNDRARHLYDELGFVPIYRNDYAKKDYNIQNV